MIARQKKIKLTPKENDSLISRILYLYNNLVDEKVRNIVSSINPIMVHTEEAYNIVKKQLESDNDGYYSSLGSVINFLTYLKKEGNNDITLLDYVEYTYSLHRDVLEKEHLVDGSLFLSDVAEESRLVKVLLGIRLLLN